MFPRGPIHWTTGLAATFGGIALTLAVLTSPIPFFSRIRESTSLFSILPPLHLLFLTTTDYNNNNNNSNTKLELTALLVFFVSNFWICVAFLLRYIRAVPPQRTRSSRHPVFLSEKLFKSATQMSRDLREGKYTSVELCTEYLNHMKEVDADHVNAILEFRDEEVVMKEAREADKKLALLRQKQKQQPQLQQQNQQKKTKTQGDDNNNGNHDKQWLLGVPMINKECFMLEGMICSSGHPARLNNRATQDADSVRRLREAGAIFLASSNLSELCMFLESSNCTGTTCNAYDASRTVMGSSGGSGASCSAVYSPAAVSSDIGGSTRLPAFASGVFGLKASSLRVPNLKQFPGTETEGHRLLVSGTVSRHPEDMFPLLKTIGECPQTGKVDNMLRDHKTFPPAPPLSDPSKVDLKNMTIYWSESLELPFTFMQPEQRVCVRTCVQKLAHRIGCKNVVEVDFNKKETIPKGWEQISKAILLWTACMKLDSVKYVNLLNDNYENEFGRKYSVFGELGKWLIGASSHTFPSIMLGVIETLEQFFISEKQNAKMVQLTRETQKAFDEVLGTDAIFVFPTLPFNGAPKHHSLSLFTLAFTYTALFNALQIPVAHVPAWMSSNSEIQNLPLGFSCASSYGNDHIAVAAACAFAEHVPEHCFCKVPEWIRVKKD